MSNNSTSPTAPFVNVRRNGDGTWSVSTSVGHFTITKSDGMYHVSKNGRGVSTGIGSWFTREEAVEGIRVFTVNTMMGR